MQRRHPQKMHRQGHRHVHRLGRQQQGNAGAYLRHRQMLETGRQLVAELASSAFLLALMLGYLGAGGGFARVPDPQGALQDRHAAQVQGVQLQESHLLRALRDAAVGTRQAGAQM